MSREPRPGLSCSLSVDSFPGYLLRLYGLRQLHADGSTLCSERLTRMSGFLIHSRSRVPSKHLELNVLRATLGWAPGRFRPHLRKRDRHPPAYQAPKPTPLLRPGSPVTCQRSAFHLGGSGRPSALPQRSERACPSPTSALRWRPLHRECISASSPSRARHKAVCSLVSVLQPLGTACRSRPDPAGTARGLGTLTPPPPPRVLSPWSVRGSRLPSRQTLCRRHPLAEAVCARPSVHPSIRGSDLDLQPPARSLPLPGFIFFVRVTPLRDVDLEYTLI